MQGINRRAARTRTKVFVVLAAGAVLGVGTTMTLASWTDTEWAFGGTGANVPGVGTSSFNVEQNASLPATAGFLTGFSDHETAPGNTIVFAPNALALTPGDTVYAPVALRAKASSVAGVLQLEAAQHVTGADVDAGAALWGALVLKVAYVTTTGAAVAPACDANSFAVTTPTYTALALTGTGLDAHPATGDTQAVAAAAGSIVHYCFQVTLPAGSPATLQGRKVAPAWLFDATSS